MAFEGAPEPSDKVEVIRYKIARALWGGAGPAGAAAVPGTGPLTTPHPVAVGASASGNIPAGALSWAFVLLTGTGTIGGVAAPLGVPISGGKLAANLAYATAGASSAFILYETAA